MTTKYRVIGPTKDLLVQRRWGWAVVTTFGEQDPCGGGGYLFRKHLWKNGVCRRCFERKGGVRKA